VDSSRAQILLEIVKLPQLHQIVNFSFEIDNREHTETGKNLAIRAITCPHEAIANEPPGQEELIFGVNFFLAA
jgi:hypothetical protein